MLRHFFAVLAGLVLFLATREAAAVTALPTTLTCSAPITGTISLTDPYVDSVSGEVSSTCGTAGGSFSGEQFRYDLLTFTNAGPAGCFTFSVTSTIADNADEVSFIVFTSSNPATAVPIGGSLPGNTISTGVTLAAGQTVYVFVTDNQGTSGSANVGYTLSVSCPFLTASASPSTSVFGQNVTFSAAVSANFATPTNGTTVSFYDGTVANLLGTGTLSGGSASFATSALGVATRNVFASFPGDATYPSATSPTTSQTVNKANTTTTLASSGTPSNFGDSVTLTATVAVVSPGSGTPDGDVTFYDTTSGSPVAIPSGTITLSGGTANLSLGTGLSATTHTYTATYNGSTSFNTSSTSSAFSQTVAKNAPTITPSTSGTPTYGTAYDVDVTVSQSVGTPTGTVTLKDGSTDLDSQTLSSGSATLTIAAGALGAGSHTLSLVYSGDSTTSNGSTPETLVFAQASTSTSVGSTAALTVYGQSRTLTATVTSATSGTPGGTVTFKDGSTTLGSGPLDTNGQATLDVSSLLDVAGSPHSVTVVYNAEDANFITSTSSPALSQSVAKAATTTALSSSSSTALPDANVTFTAGVSVTSPGAGTPTGTITLTEGTTTLATLTLGSTLTFSSTTLTVGTHTIVATYAGDANFGSSTLSIVQKIDPSATTIALTATPSSATFGDKVTLQATLAGALASGIPTGSVVFTDGTTTLATVPLDVTGAATLDVSALGAGDHTITARYVGDTAHLAVDGSVSLAIARAPSATALTSSLGSLVTGQVVTLAATVTAPGGTPTGTVTFTDGVTPLGSVVLDGTGHASLVTSKLPFGSRVLHATFSGSSNVLPSTSADLVQGVTRASTTTALTASSNPINDNATLTLAAQVSVSAPGSGTPFGLVTFSEGTKDLGTAGLVSGVASLDINSLSVGSHTVTATYAGDTDLAGSSSSTITVLVRHGGSLATLAATPPNAEVGQVVTLTATVMSPGHLPTGSVTFSEGTTVLGTGALDGNGVATLAIDTFHAGAHTLTADYDGDAQVGDAHATALLAIAPATTQTGLAVSPNPAASGQAVTASVSVSTASGTAAEGIVTLKEGATVLGTATLANGQASVTTSQPLPAGDHVLIAEYTGTGDFAASASAPLTLHVDAAQQPAPPADAGPVSTPESDGGGGGCTSSGAPPSSSSAALVLFAALALTLARRRRTR